MILIALGLAIAQYKATTFYTIEDQGQAWRLICDNPDYGKEADHFCHRDAE